MKLFFIGDKFYSESGTMMSSIYHVEKTTKGDHYRSDWGKVQIALESGEEVNIRPATDSEMLWAYKHLENYKK
jgi:hypothetical protein